MHEQICQILGLSAEAWPPDHYTLLGLKRGESDKQVIEQRVHERMRQLRSYQLSYPDQASEAMNRLAQAYGCLTDPVARQAYDESLLAPARPEKVSTPRPENGVIDPKDPLAWLFGPWDHMASPESGPASPSSRPHFRDWAASAPPPPKRQSQASQAHRPTAAVSRTPPPLEESNSSIPSASFFWRHSRILLLMLSFLALLVAVWRTFRP